jgi:hypothetical protein
MHASGRCRGALVLALLLAGLPAPATADSALRMEYPQAFGPVPAATYDTERHQVGAARLVVERLENGDVQMVSESGYTGGAHTRVEALLTPVDDGTQLAPVLQESRSFDGEGTPLGVLLVDHRERRGSCRRGDGELVGEVDLPAEDRVANVPLNLFFMPLVRKESKEIEFQLFVCGGGPRLIDFVANLAPESRNGRRRSPVVEVRYGPDFGFATLVARRFVPKLSFWFDRKAPHRWMAHRVTLYGNGPEVFVIREGVPADWFSDE